MSDLEISSGPYATDRAVEAVERSGLPGVLERLTAGPFGHTSTGLFVLESLVSAVDLGLAAEDRLRGLVIAEAAAPGSFAVPSLTMDQRRFVAAFQLVVTADAFVRRAGERVELPIVEGALELDGLAELLERDQSPHVLAQRVLELACSYVEAHAEVEPTLAVESLVAFLLLLRTSVIDQSSRGSSKHLVAALAVRSVRVAGHPYCGFLVQEQRVDAAGLLPIRAEQIVGNDVYLEAGLRLARNVAGYDFERKKNPKRINPVLLGLGRPGSGKTMTAHAIGGAFLSYCQARNVPAKFVVVRRTDWASSYQNASASNLVRIFREDVYGFDGVAGVYWPDIDTAFASRAADDLRMEEKQNLGAVFGIFDGTLIPKDGRWFLICDANNTNMDEATMSRIAQNPVTVSGPTSPEDYVRLLRDIMLADLAPFLPDAWDAVGQCAAELDLSGRNVEAIANSVRAIVQDFEYPDAYFSATFEERQAIIASLSKPVDSKSILRLMNEWSSVQRAAEERTERERFNGEVEAIVRRLNAHRAAERVLDE